MTSLTEKARQRCLVWAPQEHAHELAHTLQPEFEALQTPLAHSPIAQLEQQRVECLVIGLCAHSFEQQRSTLLTMKSRFHQVPVVAVLDTADLEVAYACGKLGVSQVLGMQHVSHALTEKVQLAIMRHGVRVSLQEMNCPTPNKPPSKLLQQALRIIERHYIALMGTRELADMLGVKEATLSREFKKHGWVGPKRLLMHFKVLHATKMLQSAGLPIRTIASASGFSHEKRLNECFQRMFSISPGEYRKKVLKPTKALLEPSVAI